MAALTKRGQVLLDPFQYQRLSEIARHRNCSVGALIRYSALNQRERAIKIVRLFVKVVPMVLPIRLTDVEKALDVHQQHTGLQARDSLHVAVMVNNGIRRILSPDQHFDAVDEVERFDPALWTHLKAIG